MIFLSFSFFVSFLYFSLFLLFFLSFALQGSFWRLMGCRAVNDSISFLRGRDISGGFIFWAVFPAGIKIFELKY